MRVVEFPNAHYRALSEYEPCFHCGNVASCSGDCHTRTVTLAEAPKRIAGQRQFTGGATVADVLDELGMDPDSINQLEASCKLALPHLRASLAARQLLPNHFPEVKE
ncbi:MAG: hypothetical protein ABSC13_06445 [Dehalococcoidia bacterium]|jgi:hypothetical protein